MRRRLEVQAGDRRRRARAGINFFKIVVQSPTGEVFEGSPPAGARVPADRGSATNHKQRLRKSIEYYHADRLNYAVIGTPNRLEYDQGFFVKNGDGSADIKPIAHLYKTQVYALARHLGLPDEVCNAARRPPTPTALPRARTSSTSPCPTTSMDLALWAHNHHGVAGCRS